MASSFVDRSKLLHTENFASLPFAAQQQFMVLEEAVGKCLCEAAKLGNIIIITNAETGWVEYSSRRFMPRLLPLLEGIRVISARSSYEKFYPSAPLSWKAAAFAHEANQLFNAPTSDSEELSKGALREIISFGDSNEERTAVKIAAGQLGAVSKSIKFCDLPSPEQLVRQLETLTGWLAWVVGHGAELDLMLKASVSDLASDAQAPTPPPRPSLQVPQMTHAGAEPWRPPAMTTLDTTA
mmetsp:Transcript_15813/g.29217  ORF Transcript_15813/g.29217 Transcript_15813/m.29217 type:complete len:239 (-) Transcript_15813:302-1018(-)